MQPSTMMSISQVKSTVTVGWSLVACRVAAVFSKEVSQSEAENLKPSSCPQGGEVVASDCAKAMCSPAPSSVFPSDISTDYQSGSDTDSVADSDGGDITLSGLDDLQPFQGLGLGFQQEDGWSRVSRRLANVLSEIDDSDFEDDVILPETDCKAVDSNLTGESARGWSNVGERLALVFSEIVDNEDDDSLFILPNTAAKAKDANFNKESLQGWSHVGARLASVFSELDGNDDDFCTPDANVKESMRGWSHVCERMATVLLHVGSRECDDDFPGNGNLPEE
jgi:hypothetical protein